MKNDISFIVIGNGTKVVKNFSEESPWDFILAGFIDALRALGFGFKVDTEDIIQAVVDANEGRGNE